MPAEIRTELTIEEGNVLDIYFDGAEITLAKHEPSCVICGAVDTVFIHIHGKTICSGCAVKLRK